MGKKAAAVILFNPGDEIYKNIESYAGKVEKLYIVDNSLRSTKFPDTFLLKYNPVFIHDGNNQGIAKRLNQVCALALQDGFDFLLTMDQDSYFGNDVIENYFDCIESFQDNAKVAMFGINHQTQSKTPDCTSKNTTTLITSGSVINLQAQKSIGTFDENLFIDFVDAEYCFRSIEKGYDIIQFPNIFMQHELGEPIEKRSVISLNKSKRSFHSAIRLYYMTRNFLYINNKYKTRFSQELPLYKKDILNRIKNKLLYSPGRFKTIQYLLQAFKDYRNNKMGKQL